MGSIDEWDIEVQFQMMRAALADIATSRDMTLELARRKAARVYLEVGYPNLAKEERELVEARLTEALASDNRRVTSKVS